MCKRIISIVFGLIIVVTFTSPGWAAPPDPNVQYSGVDVLDGDTTPSAAKGTDFGTEPVGTNVDHTFTLQNQGNKSTLNLTGTPPDYVQIIGDPEFTVIVQPATTSIAGPNGSTTFTIRFTPGSQGTFNATVSIPNDSTENPYDFAITGAGSGAPEINVLGNGVSIADGTNSPNAGDDTEFGSTGVGSNVDHTFNIENTGNADLTVGTVTVSPTTNFSVIQQPTSPIAASGSTTFTVRFSPQSGGMLPATVSIPNSDSDENPYDFGIQGTGTLAAPTVGSPSVGNVEHDTADLGGNIFSTGGENATERGVYWSTTPVPEGSGTKILDPTPGPYGTGPFTVSNVPGLNPGALIYFRAFATNSAGTGYSAEQAFQTEPASQPTGLGFSSVTSSSMTVSWTPQSGDGSIVVMKAGGPVTVDPTDFTMHNFNSDFGDVSTDLGGNNYVVYRGSGSSVDVTSLSAATTYYVAVYAFAGSGGTNPDGINYQQSAPDPLTGSQGTPAGKPTLSAPSITGSAGANSATIGATIDGDGGDPVNDFGTVWGTASQPTGNGASAGSTPGGFPYSYSHLRDNPSMPAGKRIYFRGYATNSFDTGYSPDGIFYTEPDTQASGITFSNVSYGSFTITWTPGDRTDGYDGAIVIVKKDTAVDALPVDGTAYTADSVFESGTELGTGNYVVYSGSGTTVTVTGLWHNRTYHVAIYEYSGSGFDTNYYLLTDVNNQGNQTTPEAPSHREAYNILCSECHAHSGWGDYVPRNSDQEALCQTCHVPGGQAANKADVALHQGAGVTTDCGSCHEVHHADTQASPNNVLWTTDFRGGPAGKNLNWVRGNPGTSYDPPYVPGAVGAEPIIFHNGSSGELSRADTDTNPGGYLDGLCQACHTNPGRGTGNATKYHTNNPVSNAPEDVTYGYTHPANVGGGSAGQDCRECHFHSGGFAPTVTETNCMATACHGGNTLSRRQIGESSPGAGDGEFGTNMNSHHVNDGTGSEIVTRWDCVTCHAEGDAVTGEVDQDYHAKLGVNLRHADGTGVFTDANGVYASDWAALTPAARSEYCLSCHDADGATIITGRTDPDPDATTNALNPFNDGVTNSHEPDGFDGTAKPHARIRNGGQPGAGFPGVVDVKSQFDPTNPSHHAVLGAAYGGTEPPPPGGSLAGAVFGTYANGSSGWTGTLNCEDCHYGTATTKLNGHGTQVSRYMLRNANGNDAIGDFASRTLNCHACHDVHANPTNYPAHTGQDGNHQTDGDNIFGIACLNCHGGGLVESYEDRGTPTSYVPGAFSWGMVHGVPAAAPSVTGVTPNVFAYGNAIGNVTNWDGVNISTNPPSCGAIEVVTAINNCTNHNARGTSDAKEYTRPYNRAYRAP